MNQTFTWNMLGSNLNINWNAMVPLFLKVPRVKFENFQPVSEKLHGVKCQSF